MRKLLKFIPKTPFSWKWNWYTISKIFPIIISATSLRRGSVFVTQYTIEKIPAAIFDNEDWQQALVNRYQHLNYKSQELLLQRLQEVPVSGESMNLLSEQLDKLSENQLDEMLHLFTKNKAFMLENTVERIAALTYHDNLIYAEKGYQTLQKLALKNKKVEKAIKSYEKK